MINKFFKSMSTNYFGSKKRLPEAFISVSKNRQKNYMISAQSCDDNYNAVVYLQNGDEFEIELYNPTNKKLLYKIGFNGGLSIGGYILRPGERIFVEHPIDSQRKFKFETYHVDGSNNEVKEAIKDNGIIEIKIFKEKERPPYWLDKTLYRRSFTNVPYFYGNDNDTLNFSPNCGDNSNTLSTQCCYSNVDNTCIESLETGRVEEGSLSNQHFIESSFDEEFYPTRIIKYELRPISRKPITSNELNSQKRFCPECGKKVIKKGFKFCPECGYKL